MSKQIKALIYDMEGVVIDTMNSVWIPGDIEFCRRRGFPYPDELRAKLTGSSLRDGVQIMKEYFGFQGDNKALLQERLDIADHLFKKDINFINGFKEFFKKNKHLPSAIGTSLRSQYINIVESKLKIRNLFHKHIYSIYNVGIKSKPNPDIFIYAASKLSINPENCVVIEDAPNGIEAARRAGMRSIALTTTFSRERLLDATIVVDAFKEIDLKYIEKQKSPT